MKFITLTTLSLLASICVACDDKDASSANTMNFSASTPLTDLSDDEYQEFCQWSVESWGGEDNDFSCVTSDDEDAGTFTVLSVSSCLTATKPQCTGAMIDTCLQAVHGEACGIETTDECEAMRNCLTIDGDTRGLDFILTYTPPSAHNLISWPPNNPHSPPPPQFIH